MKKILISIIVISIFVVGILEISRQIRITNEKNKIAELLTAHEWKETHMYSFSSSKWESSNDSLSYLFTYKFNIDGTGIISDFATFTWKVSKSKPVSEMYSSNICYIIIEMRNPDGKIDGVDYYAIASINDDELVLEKFLKFKPL